MPPALSSSNTSPLEVIEFVLTASGEVADYTTDALIQIEAAVAAFAGVDPSTVSATVAAGSVVLTIRIDVSEEQAAAIHTVIAARVATPQEATSMLAEVHAVGITVLSIVSPPLMVNFAISPLPPTSLSSPAAPTDLPNLPVGQVWTPAIPPPVTPAPRGRLGWFSSGIEQALTEAKTAGGVVLIIVGATTAVVIIVVLLFLRMLWRACSCSHRLCGCLARKSRRSIAAPSRQLPDVEPLPFYGSIPMDTYLAGVMSAIVKERDERRRATCTGGLSTPRTRPPAAPTAKAGSGRLHSSDGNEPRFELIL